MNEYKIQDFWQEYPCDEVQTGGLHRFNKQYDVFFKEYDDFRYTQEKHILKCLDGISFKNKKVLEIGLGQGADSEEIIRRGACWSGVDLTEESINRVKKRFQIKSLPYEDLKQGSVLDLPFEDNSFDVIYSHGVLHHVPDIEAAQQEIRRVLKPGGELIIMMYAKWSLNYLLSIFTLRRLGLLFLSLFNYNPGGIYGQHLDNAEKVGLRNYLKMSNFIHRNTDGPINPYAIVYDNALVRKHFSAFTIKKSYKRFMHAPPLNVSWMPFQKWLGWHLWVHLKPIKD